jgi:hypothetical protein
MACGALMQLRMNCNRQFLLALASVLLVAAGAARAQVAAVQPERAQDSQWVAVQDWKGGTGRTQTEFFAPGSRRWRVTFRAASGDRWGLLDVVVRTKDGRTVGSALNMHLMGFGEEQRSGSFIVENDDKEYSLEIVSDRIDWHVVVERLK